MHRDVAPPRKPFLVTSSADRAEEWRAALDAAGVDAMIELTDAQIGDPGRSALVGVLGTAPIEFVYQVLLPPAQRDRAVHALLEAGWDGREGLRGGPIGMTPGGSIRSTAIALACTAAGIGVFILIRVVAG